MKKICVVIASLEESNLHTMFYDGFINLPGIFVVPFVFENQFQAPAIIRKQKGMELIELHRKYKFDGMIFLGGFGFDKETLAEIDCRKVSWQIDDPYMFKFKQYREILPSFDSVYSTCCDSESLAKYAEINVPATYLQFGFDEKRFFPDSSGEKTIDVNFVGTPYKTRQDYLLKLRSKYPGNNVFLAGSSYPFCNIKGRIPHSVTAWIMRKSKISLNFADQPDGYFASKNRVPEIMGSGSLLLTQRFPDLLEYASPNCCVTFENKEDMIEKIKYYLSHDSEREKIAYNAYIRAIEEHKYVFRASKIINREGLIL